MLLLQLLKHLYFAVRHNDVDKVECLLKAGADYTAEVNGTGTTPRDEAKRRKHYKILKKMLSLYPREKLTNNRDDYLAIEDVSRLFEVNIVFFNSFIFVFQSYGNGRLEFCMYSRTLRNFYQ